MANNMDHITRKLEECYEKLKECEEILHFDDSGDSDVRKLLSKYNKRLDFLKLLKEI